MKNLTMVTGLLVGLVSIGAQAGTTCVVESEDITKIEINRDGGEETMTISDSRGRSTKLLVHRNHGGVTVAKVDNALYAHQKDVGVIIVKNPNGTSSVAVKSQVLTAHCSDE